MRKKIFRVTDDDETDLQLLLQMVQDFYITERAQKAELSATAIPNEASVIRALIRAFTPIAASAVGRQRAALRGEEGVVMPQLDCRELMLKLFEDGNLGPGGPQKR